jgi:hypothetical protein
MLVDPKFAENTDTPFGKILREIAEEHGVISVIRIDTGLYQIGHWNFADLLEGEWEEYPRLLGGDLSPYGVCDSPAQFMGIVGPALAVGPGQFVVSFVQLKKSDEPPKGGWRWRKWGPYIGGQDRQCEYLYDEPKIEEVWTYHIHEKIQG